MAFELAQQRLHEFSRLVANDCNITSDGVYAPNELPEDYEGDFTGKIQIVYAVIHVDIGGRVRYTTYNPPDMMNKEDETGLPLKAVIDDVEYTIRDGNKEPAITLEWVENEHLPEEIKSVGRMVWNSLVENADSNSWKL